MWKRIMSVGVLIPVLMGTALTAQEFRYEAQVSPGEVSIQATPAWVDTALVIEVSANTHSVDLSAVDLRRQARLRVGAVVIEPAVSGALRGHHAKARLLFRMPLRPAVPFTLELRDVPDVPLRTLTWRAREIGP